MLDLRDVREGPDRIKERLAVRGRPEYAELVDRVVALDQERRVLIPEVDGLRAKRNAVSKEVGRLKQGGRNEAAEPLVLEMRALGETMAGLESRLGALDATMDAHLLELPNVPEPEVPPGGEESSPVVREWGQVPEFGFEPRTHWDLAESLGLLDLPRATRMAGTGFPLFVGQGARLERALINLMLDVHTGEHGYTEMAPPLLVNDAAALGTGHLPKFGDDMYRVPEDGLWLIPTAEVPLTNLFAGELLGPEEVPQRFVAYTPCFRREAGSHGKDTRGLLRVHQFDKIELVRFERPGESRAALDELTTHAESILQRLGLRYRVLLLAGGDLGFANALTFDLEVWAPGVGRWLEVSSCSTYNDFQARRAGIRFRPATGAKPEFVHTLNGSGLGLPRTLIALLETYQQPDGRVRLPEPVARYMGTDLIGA